MNKGKNHGILSTGTNLVFLSTAISWGAGLLSLMEEARWWRIAESTAVSL